MNKSGDIDLTIQLIQKDLSLEKDALPGPATSIDELKNQLVPVIKYLLDKDMERLLFALYRIDLDERKVKEVLTLEEPDLIPSSLAGMIIDREAQKAYTRRKYAVSTSYNEF